MNAIETKRLLLRRWKEADLEPFAAMCADPRVMEFFTALETKDKCEANIAKIEKRFETDGFCLWALERKSDGAFIGLAGLNRQETGLPFAPCVEVGWRLAFQYWGNGYATEAAGASLAYGFSILGLDEIVSFTAVGNARSRAVMQRIGMVRDENGDFEHPGVPEGHKLRRHVLYRMARGLYE